MQVQHNASIKRKLLWSTGVICGAALIIALTVLFWFRSLDNRSKFAAQLQTLGAIVAQNSAASLVSDDRKSGTEALSALEINPDITGAWVFNSEGKLFVRFGSDKDAPRTATAALERGQVVFDGGTAHLSVPVRHFDADTGRLQLSARFNNRALSSFYIVAMM